MTLRLLLSSVTVQSRPLFLFPLRRAASEADHLSIFSRAFVTCFTALVQLRSSVVRRLFSQIGQLPSLSCSPMLETGRLHRAPDPRGCSPQKVPCRSADYQSRRILDESERAAAAKLYRHSAE